MNKIYEHFDLLWSIYKALIKKEANYGFSSVIQQRIVAKNLQSFILNRSERTCVIGTELPFVRILSKKFQS